MGEVVGGHRRRGVSCTFGSVRETGKGHGKALVLTSGHGGPSEARQKGEVPEDVR